MTKPILHHNKRGHTTAAMMSSTTGTDFRETRTFRWRVRTASSVWSLLRLRFGLLVLFLVGGEAGAGGVIPASFIVPSRTLYHPPPSDAHAAAATAGGAENDVVVSAGFAKQQKPLGRIRPVSLLWVQGRAAPTTTRTASTSTNFHQKRPGRSSIPWMKSLWHKSKHKFRTIRRQEKASKEDRGSPTTTTAATTSTTTLCTRNSLLFSSPAALSRRILRASSYWIRLFRAAWAVACGCWTLQQLLARPSMAQAAQVEIRIVKTFGKEVAASASQSAGRDWFGHPAATWYAQQAAAAGAGGSTLGAAIHSIFAAVAAFQNRIHQAWAPTWQSAGGSVVGFFQSFLAALGSVPSWIGNLCLSLLGDSTSSVGLQSLITAVSTHKRHILWTLVTVLTLRAVLEQQQTRRRLALDATSEWGRYARYPAARGRAIASLLLVRLLPLVIFMKLVSRRHTRRRDRLKQHTGGVFANQLLQLGPLYIKLGQILSCRENLLPPQWKQAMERLQDQVPSQSGERAQQLAYSVWPGGETAFQETFGDMNWTPVAAASLGQVHTAVLRETGASVALKLQRPFLREIYNQDFALLTKIAETVDKYFGSSAGSVGGVEQSWTEIFADAEEILYREIDYRAEAANAVRWYSAFGLSAGGKPAVKTIAKSRDGKPLPSAAPWLRTPYVYEELSTEQVLVMENVPSIKITATAKLDAANVTAEDREYLADCLGRSYLRQFCCNRFFSTDPHAGNLGVELRNMKSSVPAERVRLVYYDFGQAAELQPNQADGILEIIEAIVDMDVDRSIESFQKMGVLKEGADLEVVRAKVADNYRTGKVKANRKRLRKRGYKFKAATPASNSTNSTTTSSRGSDAAVMQYFTLPAEYAFVARALSQMDGVGKSLDPEFDFVSAAAPWIVEIKGAGLYVKEEALKWLSNIQEKIGLPTTARKGEARENSRQGVLLQPLQTGVALALVFLVSATRLFTGVEKNDV